MITATRRIVAYRGVNMSSEDLTSIIIHGARMRYASGRLEAGDAQLIVLASLLERLQEHINLHSQNSPPTGLLERQPEQDIGLIKFKHRVRQAAPTLFTGGGIGAIIVEITRLL